MALALGFKPGQNFLVGDKKVEVLEILSPTTVEVRAGDTIYTLSDDRSVEVYPEVYLSTGSTGGMATARILIEAPRSLRIVREDAKVRA